MLFFLAVLLTTITTTAQKISIKKDIAYLDDKEFLTLDGCGLFDNGCSYRNLKGEEIIFVTGADDPRDSRYRYSTVKFLGLNQTIEVRETNKGIIKILVANNAIDADGQLDPEAVNRIVEKYGNEISYFRRY
jgi:hypothetical protein